MPKIPSYRRKRLPSTNIGATPITVDPSIGGAEYRGLAALGKGIGDIGQALFKIEEKKQANRDKISNSQANRSLDEWSTTETSRIENQRYDNIDDLITDRDTFGERYTVERDRIKAGLNANVAAAFEANTNNSFAAAQYHLNRRIAQKEGNMAVADWGNNVTSLYATRPPEDSPEFELWQQKYNSSRKAYSFHLNEHDLEATEIQALINAGIRSLATQKLADSTRLEPNEIATFQARINSGNKKADDAQEAIINEANKNIIDILAQDPDNIGVIDNLPPDLKDMWNAKLVERDKWMKTNPDSGDPFINVRDFNSNKFKAFNTLLDSSSTKLSELEIASEIGAGLTISDAQFLIDKKRSLETDVNKLKSQSPAYNWGITQIKDAWDTDIIRAPGFVPGDPEQGTEEYRQNAKYMSGLLDQFTEWAKAGDAPRTWEETSNYINKVLSPHQEMAATGIFTRLKEAFSYELWSIRGFTPSDNDFENALGSMNQKARDEWTFNKKGILNVTPIDFLHSWRSPNKIATPEIKTIYLKWAHGDDDKAFEMMTRDEWLQP